MNDITAKECANDIKSWLQNTLDKTIKQKKLSVKGSPFYINKSIRESVYKQVIDYINTRDYLQ